MPVARTLLLLSATAATANAGWAHGWRDQYIRVSQRLSQKVSAEMRHLRKLGLLSEGAPEHLKQKARDAVRHAERVHHAQRHNARELAKPEHLRRKLMEVECEGRTCTVNGITHADMSLFDCPWINSLHPYFNTTITKASLSATGSLPGVEPAVKALTESPHPYLRANPNPFVDGGLCLPFQEIPFPYPSKTYGGIDKTKTAANIQCPGPDWDPDAGACSSGPGTCQYPGDEKLHGGPTGVAENYGCAAASFGWPSTSAETGEMDTPICKTYVDGCTYSKKSTRKYKYAKAAAEDPLSLGGGYDYNWVLWSISKIRNTLVRNITGLTAAADMEGDLNGDGYAFPTTLYELLYGKEEGTAPPTEGAYPHAVVKGLFTNEGVVDTAQAALLSSRRLLLATCAGRPTH